MSHKLDYPIIGIAGTARSGKNTAANYLTRLLTSSGIPTRVACFADPVRTALLAIDPIVHPWGTHHAADAIRLSRALNAVGGWEEIKSTTYGPEVRRLLQNLGTDAIRTLDPDFWVRQLESDILAHPADLTIVPDVRFENEAETIRSHGLLLYIQRDDAPTASSHISETGVTAIRRRAIVIDNSSLQGTYDQLAYVHKLYLTNLPDRT